MKHCRNCEGNKAEAHHGDEELLIAHLVGHPAAHHTWQHHAAKVLKGCAEGEDRVGHPAAHHTWQHHAAKVLKGCAEGEDRGASLAMMPILTVQLLQEPSNRSNLQVSAST